MSGSLGLQRRQRRLDLERGADHRGHDDHQVLERQRIVRRDQRHPDRQPPGDELLPGLRPAHLVTQRHAYSVTAKATDFGRQGAPTPLNTFTYSTTAPSVAVSYPVRAPPMAPTGVGP